MGRNSAQSGPLGERVAGRVNKTPSGELQPLLAAPHTIEPLGGIMAVPDAILTCMGILRAVYKFHQSYRRTGHLLASR